MTIRTKEADAPNDFPPARLFLDDIEEIVRILVDATEKKEKSIRPDKSAKITLTLTIKDQVCDEVQEVTKIARKTFDLSIDADAQGSLSGTCLSFDRHRTHLFAIGFTREEKLGIYHKLVPIFKRRNLWLATLIHSHRALVLTLIAVLCLASWALLKKPTTWIQAHMAALPGIALTTIFLATAFHHSVIILRHSSEHSPLRQELAQKIPVVVISSVLTFLLTLLGFYLKHKYWP